MQTTYPRLSKQAVQQVYREEQARKLYQSQLRTYESKINRQRPITQRHTQNIAGYVDYLYANFPELEKIFLKKDQTPPH